TRGVGRGRVLDGRTLAPLGERAVRSKRARNGGAGALDRRRCGLARRWLWVRHWRRGVVRLVLFRSSGVDPLGATRPRDIDREAGIENRRAGARRLQGHERRARAARRAGARTTGGERHVDQCVLPREEALREIDEKILAIQLDERALRIAG